MLKAESTIGILGGGQLGRMLALAAARLGFSCHIYSPDTDSCAFEVVKHTTCAAYEDVEALARFAEAVDVVTYEFENVPAAAASVLSAHRQVLPDPAVLATTQDRLIEKRFVDGLGIATAAFADVSTEADLGAAVKAVGARAVLKTRRLGYDGKGQKMIASAAEAADAWRELRQVPCILEGFVPFEREISVVAARGHDGAVECFDVTENEHRDHILKVSKVPAAVSAAVAAEARRIAEAIAGAFSYVGVLAVEMFVVRDGAGHTVLVNEIAPRVHNSGHWTIDGASVSQFEQHIRAVAGWPLGKPVRRGRVEMTNLIGPEAHDYGKWLLLPDTAVHLYGKKDARPGRKMGHVTRVLAD
ncbi:MAG TPA: 5-(carboxyamino)imidazole ribonucleotide synthase [Pseudolabrys sp.]|nr:5-(carboxyamino)imidazole ribonucleotide synthase [Pseudolabrys sp.]